MPPYRLVTCPAGLPPAPAGYLPYLTPRPPGACRSMQQQAAPDRHPGGSGTYHQRPGHCHTSTPAPAGYLPCRTTPAPAGYLPYPAHHTKKHREPSRKHIEPETHQHRNPPNNTNPTTHPTGRAPPGTTVWEHKTSTGTTTRTTRENTVGDTRAQTQASQTPTGGAQAGHDSYG